MHEDVLRFTRDKILIKDNKDFERLKDVLIRDLEDEMHMQGVLRNLDIDPHWSVEYIVDKNYWECTLSLYGIFVGEDDCPGDKAFSHGKQIKIR